MFCFIFSTVNAACVMHGQSYCQVIFGVTFILSLFDICKQSAYSVKFCTKHYCVRGFPGFIFILEDIIYLVCLGWKMRKKCTRTRIIWQCFPGCESSFGIVSSTVFVQIRSYKQIINNNNYCYWTRLSKISWFVSGKQSK